MTQRTGGKPMTVEALMDMAYSSVGSAHELRAAIEQYGKEQSQPREPLTEAQALELATQEFPYWREDIQTAFVLQLTRAIEQAHNIRNPHYPCRSDGRCQYAIDHGAEGMGHCPAGKCAMPEGA